MQSEYCTVLRNDGSHRVGNAAKMRRGSTMWTVGRHDGMKTILVNHRSEIAMRRVRGDSPTENDDARGRVMTRRGDFVRVMTTTRGGS